MTDITELAQLRAELSNPAVGSKDHLRKLALSLVEALEKAQRAQPCEHSMFWDASGVKRCSKCDLPEHANIHYADAAEMEIAALRQRIDELESSGIAPGILRCTECSFVLTKNIISVTADTITTGNSEPEPCPNGCGLLQPVTWKALAIQLMFTTKQRVSDLLEAKKRIAELESFRTAYMEWGDKTDWVQTDKRFDVLKPWGKHRADVLREYIEHLESRTVKLPDDAEHDIMAPVAAYLSEKFKWDGSAVRWDGRNEYDVLADRVKYALRMVIRRASGIKVEAE